MCLELKDITWDDGDGIGTLRSYGTKPLLTLLDIIDERLSGAEIDEELYNLGRVALVTTRGIDSCLKRLENEREKARAKERAEGGSAP